jgi:RND family efflux transporter MFP subunit
MDELTMNGCTMTLSPLRTAWRRPLTATASAPTAAVAEAGTVVLSSRFVPVFIAVFSLALFVPSAARAAASATAAPPANRPALVVNTVRPQKTDIADTLSANGSINAWQEAAIGAEVNGLRIAEVRVDVGASVKRGQVLAVFATETVRADLANVEAALAEARAGLVESQAASAEAQANADRAKAVEPSGALSAQQIAQYLTAAQTARARVQSAQARVQSAQAQVQSQQLRLKMTQVMAPDDGIISARLATVGAVVPAGQELFRVVRKGRLEWRAEVTATELARVRPNQPVKVFPAAGGSINGTVRMVGPVVDAQTRNALVYVDLPAGSTARAGMFARGDFQLGSSSALTVPQQAVVVRDGFAYVYRVAGDRVSQQKLVLGRRVGDRIEVREGLTADAVLVAAGAGFLNDGDLVQVVPATAAATAPAPVAPIAPATGAGK